MTISLVHTFHSGIADGGDSTLVQPSNWNAEHTISMATAKVLGRATAGTGAVEELATTGTGSVVLATAPSIATSLTLTGGGTLTPNGGNIYCSVNFGDSVGAVIGSGGLQLANNATLAFSSDATWFGSKDLTLSRVSAGLLGIAGAASITQGTANAAVLSSTGYSLTGSATQAMIDLAGTWNTSGVATGIKLNLTNTASGVLSKYIDCQIAGATAFAAGYITSTIGGIWLSQGTTGLTPSSTNYVLKNNAGNVNINAVSGGIVQTRINDGLVFQISSTQAFASGVSLGLGAGGAMDIFFTRIGAAQLQFGAANAASPVAQTLQTQGSRSGTDSNVGGASLTLAAGIGTGTGTISSLILKSPVAVASGTGAQTSTTGLTISGGQAVTSVYTVATLPTGQSGGVAYVSDGDSGLAWGATVINSGAGATKYLVWYNGSNWTVAAK